VIETGSVVSAVIGFRRSPSRNWINPWKPTIDALGPLLGEGDRLWHPRDGAIVDLALHLLVDPELTGELLAQVDEMLARIR
jgi:hypothetical protein